jgi:hypothetical protein
MRHARKELRRLAPSQFMPKMWASTGQQHHTGTHAFDRCRGEGRFSRAILIVGTVLLAAAHLVIGWFVQLRQPWLTQLPKPEVVGD